MADLTRIDITIQTGNAEGAGTDGEVYLGICGREFHCDSKANDFERGSKRTYTFGTGSNVLSKNRNDPRKPQLAIEDVDLFPLYIRFEQLSNSDWNLQFASLSLNGSLFPIYEFRSGDGIWLGRESGACVYLRKHIDPIPAAPTKSAARKGTR